jgi:hypothetical protein
MHRIRSDAKVIIDDEETLNLEDWINIFHGPPCDVDSMVELVQDNNRRGKFLPPKEETPEGVTYANANQSVRVVFVCVCQRLSPFHRMARRKQTAVMFAGEGGTRPLRSFSAPCV